MLDADGRRIVRSCNVARDCSESGEIDVRVIRAIDDAFDRTACREKQDKTDSSNTTVALFVLTTVIFGIMVLMLLIVILKMMMGSHHYGNKTAMTTVTVTVTPDGRHPPIRTSDRGFLTMHETDCGSLTNPLGNPNFKLSDIEIREPLGRGSFGKVYKGHWQGTDVAVKCIIHGRSFLETRNEPFEAYLSRQVSHPNVVQTFIVHTVPAGAIEPLRLEAGQTPISELGNTASQKHSIDSDEIFGSLAQVVPTVHHKRH